MWPASIVPVGPSIEPGATSMMPLPSGLKNSEAPHSLQKPRSAQSDERYHLRPRSSVKRKSALSTGKADQ
jgi:hypothetical protein